MRMGIDRRRHRLFMTRHTEYHLRSEECVGVRDRESGAWQREHAALRLHAMRVPPLGEDGTWIGERLQFYGNNMDVVTSPITAVGRPARKNLPNYVTLAVAGTISVS